MAVIDLASSHERDEGEDAVDPVVSDFAVPVYSNQDDRPNQELYWYRLLLSDDDGHTAALWFQQLGLRQDVVKDDLVALYNADPTTTELHLLEMKAKYPIIFEALDAVFGLMPSNSRIAEQSHGFLRDFLKSYHSLSFADQARSYVANIEYYNREERRNRKRKRAADDRKRKRAATDDDDDEEEKKRATKKTALKHDSEKIDQCLLGQQLTLSCERYSRTSINALPEDLQQQLTARALRGSLEEDKAMLKADREQAEARVASSRSGPTVLGEWRSENEERISSLGVDNDEDWIDPKIQERRDNIDRLLSKSYWSKITLRQGFWKELEDVLPRLWNSKDWSTNKPTKTDACMAVAAYGEGVEALSKKEKVGPADFDGLGVETPAERESIAESDPFGRKESFVCYDKATKLTTYSRENLRLIVDTMKQHSSTQEMKIIDSGQVAEFMRDTSGQQDDSDDDN